jgi:hypothetical protein
MRDWDSLNDDRYFGDIYFGQGGVPLLENLIADEDFDGGLSFVM